MAHWFLDNELLPGISLVRPYWFIGNISEKRKSFCVSDEHVRFFERRSLWCRKWYDYRACFCFT